jgi:N-acylneuraminate cytidylyltransferase
MKTEKITALIPVRAGSTRLKDKNISNFAGTNLLLYKIQQLKQVSLIDKIVVSSDSEIMLKMAKDADVEIQRRPIEYCDEISTTFSDVVEWVASNLSGDHILWSTVTSPLTNSKDYENAIIKYYEVLGEYDSLVSFEKLNRFVWNENEPINYTLGNEFGGSKNLKPLYVKTCGISLAPRESMIKWKFDHGINPYKYILDKKSSVDIDDIYDLVCARAWLDI